MGWLATLKEKAKRLKRESMVLYFAARDPRTPLIVKLIAGAIVAYALSPIDLIPDFIPVLGLVDEVILLPIAIAFALRLVPSEVLLDAQTKAQTELARPKNYKAAAIIVLIWAVVFAVLLIWAMKAFS
jgi:uncharacterized membrane protein YkvA (DUF1232 family)